MPWTGAGLGTVSGRIAFTNLAAWPCRLRGWPVLRLVTPQGAVTVAKDRLFVMSGPTLRTAPLVILRHGTTAEAVFTGGDNPLLATEGMCPSYRFLGISPPGDSRAATLPAWIWYYGHDMPACTRIFISPVVPWADLYQGRQDNDPAGRAFSHQLGGHAASLGPALQWP